MDREEDNSAIFKLRDGWYAKAKEQRLETLQPFLEELAAHAHDYNTICYAITAAAIGAAWAVERSPQGGITGFQSGAIMWEFIQQWQDLQDEPLRLVEYRDMLYPQYEDRFTSISESTAKWLKEEAEKQLANSGHMHEEVRAHLEKVASGAVPFGYSVRN